MPVAILAQAVLLTGRNSQIDRGNRIINLNTCARHQAMAIIRYTVSVPWLGRYFGISSTRRKIYLDSKTIPKTTATIELSPGASLICGHFETIHSSSQINLHANFQLAIKTICDLTPTVPLIHRQCVKFGYRLNRKVAFKATAIMVSTARIPFRCR
jgi:hypothetical protein